MAVARQEGRRKEYGSRARHTHPNKEGIEGMRTRCPGKENTKETTMEEDQEERPLQTRKTPDIKDEEP